MSVASAIFRSQTGVYYKVQLTSDNITSDETLTLAGRNPVSISFRAGEHKFPGFRSVECQITLLADKDMSYLYSDIPTGTKVEILSSTNGSSGWITVFLGYLEPFTFDQPYTLCNDEVTLTAIDAISILKFSPYETSGGHCRQAAIKFITDICDEAGIDTIDISPDNELSGYQISTNAFLPNNFTDRGEVNKMQVLSYICQMRGLTATPWGKKLYIIDTANELTGTSWTSGRRYTINHTTHNVATSYISIGDSKTIQDSDFRAGKAKLSIERPYGRIRYSLPNSGTGYIIAPLLDKGTPVGSTIEYYMTDAAGAKYVTTRRLLTGTGIEWHAYNRQTGAELGESDFISNFSLLNPDSNNDWVGAIPIEITYFRRDSEYSGVTKRRCIWVHQRSWQGEGYLGDRTLFQVKPEYRGILQTGSFKVNMSAARGQVNRTGDNFFPPVLGNSEGVAGPLGFYFLNLWCGQYYYTEASNPTINGLPTGQWLLGGHVPFILGRPDSHGIKDILTTFEAMYQGAGWSGWIDDVSSPAGGWPNDPWNFGYEVFINSTLTNEDSWIFDFSVENVGYDASESALQQDLNNGVYKGDTLDIKLPLRNSGYGRDNALFPQSESGVAGKLGARLAQRYITRHKGFEMTVGDDVQMWAPITYKGNRYTMDSMIWNLEAGTKTIYIN